ncbi:MAG: hypothetical protein PHR96_03010 [Clostridia bacterium]|nr:hypothetical protein [Clostridia bacterium]
MYKIIINSILIIYLCFALSCNANEYNPINVTFKNGTLPGSENYVVTAVFLEDKRIRDKYTDIYIMANLNEIKLSIGKEPNQPVEILLTEKDKWYSLTDLMSQSDFATFAKAQTTTYIITSETIVTLKFKAVGGELNQDNSGLTSTFNVSKVFEIEIVKVKSDS